MNDALPPIGPNIPGLTPALRHRLRVLLRLAGALHPSWAARLALRLFTTPRARALCAQDSIFLAGAAATRLETARGELQLYEWPGAGPAVLVLHGWISHAARLRETIEILCGRGLRVVTFDAPAHGRSPGRRLDLPMYREAMAAVAAACGPIGAVVAHSFGALTALSWLAERPAGSNLRAAVLVGVPHDAGYLLDAFASAMGLEAAVLTRLRGLFRARYGDDPEGFSAARLAQQLRVPLLLVHGGADEFVPAAHSAAVAQSVAGARLHVAPGLLHSGPLRDPATLELMADFIAGHLQESQ